MTGCMVNFAFVITDTLDNTAGLFSEKRNYSFVIWFRLLRLYIRALCVP